MTEREKQTKRQRQTNRHIQTYRGTDVQRDKKICVPVCSKFEEITRS